MRDVLLIDLENVLAPFDFGKAAKKFSEMTGLESVELQRIMTGERLFAICAGELEPQHLFDELGERVGKSLARERVENAWCDIFLPDLKMNALCEALAAKYETHLWSNVDALHRAWLWPQLSCLTKFRGLHLLYEMRAAKPNREFYQRAIANGRIDAARAIFVDDIQENLDGAAKFGIATILHKSADETQRALAELGIAP